MFSWGLIIANLASCGIFISIIYSAFRSGIYGYRLRIGINGEIIDEIAMNPDYFGGNEHSSKTILSSLVHEMCGKLIFCTEIVNGRMIME